MESKEQIVKNLKSQIGWIYPDLKWLKEEETQFAEKNREKLLRSLSRDVRYSFSRNKLHIGKLSPGCLICGQGYWSCMFINGLCTANCFYCPQDRGIKKERYPQAEGIIFEDVKDYIDYLEKFGFRGVGFSGGESLLVFEQLLKYINEIKRRFGDKLYLWIYTNGDLVNKDKLRKLKESGLDEIRLNISARAYNLHSVELAVGVIDTVTVEIPCIPEDYGKVRNCLAKMQKIGVDHLNVHQLLTTGYNYKNFVKRNYTFLHQQFIPVLESEIFALKLVRYALDHEINLPINYCSGAYKARLQSSGLRQRWAPFVKDDFEDVTDLGCIRQFSIKDSPEQIKRIVKIMQENERRDKPYSLNDTKTEVFLSKTTLKRNTREAFNLIVTYFEPKACPSLDLDKTNKEIKLPSGKSIFIIKEPIFRWEMSSSVAKRSFYKIFFEHKNTKEALKHLFRHYNLNSKSDINDMQKEIKNLMCIKPLEFLETGSPEIY